ncbi:MAG: fatty acyl-AMP ligase [Myxococcota bacterium]
MTSPSDVERPRTVIEVIRDNAVETGHAITFVRADGRERVVPYPDLWVEVRRRAAGLAARGLKKGDRIALILPEPDEFVLTFLGALAAGVVAVPMYPPQTMAKLEAYGNTLRHVLGASDAGAVVVGESVREMLAQQIMGSETPTLAPGELHVDEVPASLPTTVTLDDLAFLQFTSGSTSRPKGVMVSFGNLAANARAIMFDGLEATPVDKGVSWLPLFHDMGLIGFVVAPLYAKVQVMLLPTTRFIRRPSMWLEAIDRFRGTITFAPNFAFALATRAVRASQAQDWDLSCMRALGCGAEPIQADVLRGFLDRFAAQGLAPTSILPSYGMAEATLAISFADLHGPLRTDVIDTEALKHGRAEPVAPDAPGRTELVSCGRAFPGHDVVVVADIDGAPAPERTVGEIWTRGPSCTAGYFDNPEASAETFSNGWLRTGDLGYLADGELYICGREKDLIILNGKNYYPQDIERIVSAVEGVRDDQCVAFSRLDPSGAEVAVVVAEGRRAAVASDEVRDAIVAAVRQALGVTIDEVVFIPRGTLPKTSSGKVQRRAARQRLEAGSLPLLTPELTIEDEALSERAPVS